MRIVRIVRDIHRCQAEGPLQAAKLRVRWQGSERAHDITGDGMLIATRSEAPATIVRLVAPHLLLDSGLLVMTGLAVRRPAGWSRSR